MAGDDARDRLASVIAIADPDADVLAAPQALTTLRVVDTDLDGRTASSSLAFWPREVASRVATETATEDCLQRSALLIG